MKRSLLTILLISLTFAVNSNAALEKGDNEVDFSINWQKIEAADSLNDDVDTFTLSGSILNSVTNEIQLGIFGSGTWTDDYDVFNIGAKGAYNFNPQNKTIPYVGAQVAYSDINFDDGGADGSGLMYGPLVGVKFFVTPSENVFVFAEYQYQLFTGDLDDVYDSINLINVGLGIKF
jgi:hypothetical protein